jgi:nicotinate-nucleotide pyrophosphorylase
MLRLALRGSASAAAHVQQAVAAGGGMPHRMEQTSAFLFCTI